VRFRRRGAVPGAVLGGVATCPLAGPGASAAHAQAAPLAQVAPSCVDTDREVSGVIDKPPRKLRLRYPATCASCGISLSRGAEAIWDGSAKTVTCLACVPDGSVQPGEAGASAAAEGAQRAERKVDAARRKYGDHAGEVAREMAAHDAAMSWVPMCANSSFVGSSDIVFMSLPARHRDSAVAAARSPS
jgi:hypothetical protein